MKASFKRRIRSLAAAMAAGGCAVAAGCVSVDRCAGPELSKLVLSRAGRVPREHIVVSNFGYYLFNAFPLICGNTDPDGWLPFSFFSDKVVLPEMQKLLAKEARRVAGTEIDGLTSHYDAAPCFSVSTDPKSALGLLFCYREVQLSATFTETVREPEPEAVE